MTQRLIKLPKEQYLEALQIQKYFMFKEGKKYPLYQCLLMKQRKLDEENKNMRFRL